MCARRGEQVRENKIPRDDSKKEAIRVHGRKENSITGACEAWSCRGDPPRTLGGHPVGANVGVGVERSLSQTHRADPGGAGSNNLTCDLPYAPSTVPLVPLIGQTQRDSISKGAR